MLVPNPNMAPIMASLAVLGKGILLGLGAAVPFGPVNVEITRRTLGQGPRAGLGIGAGASTIDVCYATLVALGAAPLVKFAIIRQVLTVLSIILLTFFGLMSIKSALFETNRTDAIAVGPKRSFGACYLQGLAMTGLNPFTMLFWFTVVAGQVANVAGQSPHALPMLCIGVFASTIGWVIFFVTVLSLVHRAVGPKLRVAADIFGGVTLLGFAIYTLWTCIQRPL